MNSDIRYLQLLEDDLVEAAKIERELDEEEHATGAGDRTHRRWLPAAAGLVALLVLAGGIGFLDQHGDSGSAALRLGPGTIATPRVAAPTPTPGAPPGFEAANHINPRTADVSFGDTLAQTSSGKVDAQASPAPSAPQTDLSKIVRDGRIGVLLPNGAFRSTTAKVLFVAKSNHGMVLTSTTQNEQSGQFVLRIPAKNFDHAMGQLAAIGAREGSSIEYRDTTGQDVTSQFVDLKARLDILKGQRDLLLGLRAKATSVGQILSLSNQINQVQLQIEQIQGQLNVIDNQVAESTIKVSLRERGAPDGNPDHVDNPSLSSAWHRSVQGLLRVIGAVIVGLGYLLPVMVIGLLAWGIVTLVRRRRRATS